MPMPRGRRQFLAGVSASTVALVLPRSLAAQVAPVPKWVPIGFPAFYQDVTYGGLLVHKQRDLTLDYTKWIDEGGDTAQREGFTWFAIALLQRYGIPPLVVPTHTWSGAIALLEDPNKPGEFRRHPDLSHPDWSDPKHFSRDQQTPVVAALGALGPATTLRRLWTAFEGRGRLCQNSELGGPDHQNLFFRAGITGQVEAFGEFQLAAMSLSIAARGAGDLDDVGDDLNYLVQLAASHLWRPTKTSAQAICQYARTRPINYGCYLERYRDLYKDLLPKGHKSMVERIEIIRDRDPRPECHPIVGALRWYFRTEEGAPWGPAALWEQVVTSVLLPAAC
jgi:hypothetical protein